MPGEKIDFFFVTRRGVAEAVDENPQLLLNLDFRVPDQVIAFISPAIHAEVSKQFLKNPDLDGVALRASFSSLITSACEFFEDDKSIEQWIKALEKSIQLLRSHQSERQAALENALCKRCGHRAADHHQPHQGDLACRQRDCTCSEYVGLAPLVSEQDQITALSRSSA